MTDRHFLIAALMVSFSGFVDPMAPAADGEPGRSARRAWAAAPASKAAKAEKRAEREAEKPKPWQPPAAPASPDPLAALMPQTTADETLAKIKALSLRYWLPAADQEITAADRRRLTVALSAQIAVCQYFEAHFANHPGRDWAMAMCIEAVLRLSDVSDRRIEFDARRIAEAYAEESGEGRRHPIYLITQLHQNLRQYARELGSLGNFRDSSLQKRNQLLSSLQKLHAANPKLPGLADLMVEFGRNFYLIENYAVAKDLLSRVADNYPGTYEAAEASRVLELVKRATTPLSLSYTDPGGRRVDLSLRRGRVVVLMFYNPAEDGIDNVFERVRVLLERYRDDGLDAISFAQNVTKPSEFVMPIVTKGVKFAHVCDDPNEARSIATRLGVAKTPAFVLLDHNGCQKAMLDGPGGLETEVFHLISVQRSMAKSAKP